MDNSLPPISAAQPTANAANHPDRAAARQLMEALQPGPVSLPGVNIRNPLTGRSRTYSHYPWQVNRSLSKVSPHHMKEHERSIFTHTTYGRNYFIIAPDWTSEGVGRKRLIAKERGHTSWDSRPGVQPLSEFIIPILERRANTAGVSVEEMYNRLSTRIEHPGGFVE